MENYDVYWGKEYRLLSTLCQDLQKIMAEMQYLKYGSENPSSVDVGLIVIFGNRVIPITTCSFVGI